MSELKTLKDILKDWEKQVLGPLKAVNGKEIPSLYHDLKAEAVKWVKEEIEISKSLKNLGSERASVILNYSVMRWKKRFNLTEEDLK